MKIHCFISIFLRQGRLMYSMLDFVISSEGCDYPARNGKFSIFRASLNLNTFYDFAEFILNRTENHFGFIFQVTFFSPPSSLALGIVLLGWLKF